MKTLPNDLLNSFLPMEILDGDMNDERMHALLEKYGVAFSYYLTTAHLESIRQRLSDESFKKMFIKDETVELFVCFKKFIEETYPIEDYPEKWI